MAMDSIFLIGFFQKTWEWLDNGDRQLFLLVNGAWNHPWLDAILPIWREANTWMPLYLFLILFVVINFPTKAFSWILTAIICFAISDQMSSSLLKPFFARLRPCNDPELVGMVRLLLPNCGSGYSFTSSHATNHFAFGIFVFLTMGQVLGKWKWAFLFWAGSVAYAQVYVGVHYPLDVLSGAILGSLIGWAMASIFQQRFHSLQIDTQNKSK
jgi:membrane-associated phospholipid phosphatase